LESTRTHYKALGGHVVTLKKPLPDDDSDGKKRAAKVLEDMDTAAVHLDDDDTYTLDIQPPEPYLDAREHLRDFCYLDRSG